MNLIYDLYLLFSILWLFVILIKSPFIYSAELLSAADDSALQLHIKGRNLKRSLVINEPEKNDVVEKLNLLKPHCVLEIIYNYGVMNLGDCCQKTWSKLSQYEPDYIRIRSKTDKHFWDDVRQYRITGSRCYSLYTYNIIRSSSSIGFTYKGNETSRRYS